MQRKTLFVMTALLVAFLLLFAGCAKESDEPAEVKVESVNVRQELVRQSALETIMESGKLRVGFEAGYMPFEMSDKQGNFIGFDMDMARAMADALDVELVYINTGWDGIIPSLQTHKFDIIMSGMTVLQERNKAVLFADPYIVIGQALIVNSKHKGVVNSYKDLNDPSFIVTSKLGTTGESAAQEMISKCTYKSFETESEAAMEVVNGNADAFVYDLPYCEVFNSQQGSDKIYILNQPFTYEPLAWAINRGDPDFLNWLNNFLVQVKNDGRYDQMYAKWIQSNSWLPEVAD